MTEPGGHSDEHDSNAAFLLRLTDTLRQIGDASRIQAEAARLVGEFTGANRVGYAQDRGDGVTVAVTGDYHRDVPSLAGVYRYVDYGVDLLRELQAGRIVVRPDIANDAVLSAEEKAAHAVLQLGATLNAPLIRNGRLVAIFFVHFVGAHAFSEAEVALARDVADRLWDATARAYAERDRQVAETALAAQRRLLEATLSSIPDYVYAFDRQHRFVYVNRTMQTLFGDMPLLGRTFADLDYPVELAARLNAHIETVFATGETVHDEVYYVSPIGLGGYFDYSWGPVLGPDGEVELVVGVSRDTTARRRMEDQLRSSEQRLLIALEAGRMGTYWYNLATGQQVWSDSQYDLLGVDRTEQPSRELFMSLVHPDDIERVGFTTADIRKEGTYLDASFRIIRPSGELRYLISHALAVFGPDGTPAELVGVNQDVTERVLAERAAASSEERLREFGDASPNILWVRDAETMRWDYLSPAFDRIHGVSRLDALRDDNFPAWLAMVHAEDRDMVQSSLARVRAGERLEFDYRITRAHGGEVRWLRETAFPIRDDGNVVRRLGGVVQDTTALKSAEDHQRVLLGELQHRVRNTLSVIRSIARRTARTSRSVEDYAVNLEGRINSFARVQGAVTRTAAMGVDLALIVAEELRAVSAREGERVTIEGPSIRLMPKAAETLGLAIHELATNAVKYGALSHDGRIDVAWTVTATQLELRWRETSIDAFAANPTRRGFGSEILERTVPYELGGDVRLSFDAHGVVYTVTLPIDRVAAPVAPPH